jgi:hypothetical protein
MIGGYRLHTNVQARAVPLPVIPGTRIFARTRNDEPGGNLRFLPAAAFFERNGA